MCFIPIYVTCPALSAAAKKAASSSSEVSGDMGEGEEGEKEGVNGEVEGESNGKVKEGEGAACGSKLRTCRRTGAGEASGAGKRLVVAQVELGGGRVWGGHTAEHRCFA